MVPTVYSRRTNHSERRRGRVRCPPPALPPGTDPSELPLTLRLSVGWKASRPVPGPAALEQPPPSLPVPHQGRSQPRAPREAHARVSVQGWACRWSPRRLPPCPGWTSRTTSGRCLCVNTRLSAHTAAGWAARGPSSSYPRPHSWARCHGAPPVASAPMLPSTALHETRGGAQACLSLPDRPPLWPLAPSIAGKSLHSALQAVCSRPPGQASSGVPAGEVKLLPTAGGQAQRPLGRATREVTSRRSGRPLPVLARGLDPCPGYWHHQEPGLAVLA